VYASTVSKDGKLISSVQKLQRLNVVTEIKKHKLETLDDILS
jgi:hypothetical protein